MNARRILCKIIRRRLFSGENRTPLSQRGGKQNEDNLSKRYFKGWQPLCFADDVQEDHSQGSDKELKGYKALGAPRAINNTGIDDNKNSLTALCPVQNVRAHGGAVGLSKIYSFIVIISSTNKYMKHKSSMLI